MMVVMKDLSSLDQVTQHYRTGPDPGHVRKLVDQGDCVRMKGKEVLATLAVQRGSWCRVCRWPAGGATAASPSTPGPRRRPSLTTRSRGSWWPGRGQYLVLVRGS